MCPGLLTSKVAMITGASSGIGEATARAYARAGAIVVLAARRRERLERIAHEIRAEGGSALPQPTDLTAIAQVAALVEQTLAAYHRIDILANIAGWGRYDWIEEMSAEDLRRQFEVNILGMADLVRQVVPVMKAQKAGVILIVSSYASEISVPPLTIYASTKYAVEGLSDGLRRELAPWGIAVVRVHPGGVSGTEFNRQAAAEGGIEIRALPLGRITRERLASEMVRLAAHPRRALYISRWYDIPVFINRVFPGLVDWFFTLRVRRMRREAFRAAGRIRPARYAHSFPGWILLGGLVVLVTGLLWAVAP